MVIHTELKVILITVVLQIYKCGATITCDQSSVVNNMVECKSHNQYNSFDLNSIANIASTPINYLSAKGCGIYKLDQRIFATRKTITHLDLSNNFLKDTNALTPLNNILLDLDISGNIFMSPTPPRIFANHPKITKIVMSHNPLNVIHWKIFFWSVNLLTLDMSFCDIPELPLRLFEKPTQLQDLNVSNNNIANLHQNIFGTIPKLKTIDLSNNNLRSLPKTLFDKNILLEKIDLSSNFLSVFDATTFHKTPLLNSLYLSSNQLTGTLWSVIQGLQELKELRVDNNKIEQVITGTAIYPKLQHFKLACNHIDHLPMDFFEKYSSLQELSVYGNPWKCSCFRYILARVEEKNLRLLANSNTIDSLPVCVMVGNIDTCDNSAIDLELWKYWIANGGNISCQGSEYTDESNFVK